MKLAPLNTVGDVTAAPARLAVAKKALDSARAEGKAAVSLIDSAASVGSRPVGLEGQGRLVNTHA